MPNERDQGRVEAIYLAVDATGEPEPVEEAEAVPGRGLRGDRYFDGSGTFFEPGKSGQDLTLVEAEAIEGMAESGIEIEPGESRRNVLTRGIDVNALVGRRFRVGDVECVGVELCHPCKHLESVTKPGVIKGLANRGGLNADILTDGEIAVGDRVEELVADSG